MRNIDHSNARFEIQNKYSIEDFSDLWLAFRLKTPGKAPPKQLSSHGMRMLAWFMILTGAMIESVYLWLRSIIDLPFFQYAWIFSIAGIILLIRGVPRNPRWVQKAWKNYEKQQYRSLIVRFMEEEFEICSHNQSGKSDCRYSYSFVDRVWEDEKHFYIKGKPNALYILQKSGFIQGSLSDFPEFLTEKTGLPVQWVNGART